MRIERKAIPEARELAERALRAAEPLGKPSALALAHVALGRSPSSPRFPTAAPTAASTATTQDPACEGKEARCNMARVIVEHVFTEPFTDERYVAFAKKLDPCLDVRNGMCAGARWQSTGAA